MKRMVAGSQPVVFDPARYPLISRRRFAAGAAATAVAASFPGQSLYGQGSPNPIVKTSIGSLRGEVLPGGVRVFRGVPFAEPPVGKLRFRAPLPPAPWKGTREALRFGPAAMQEGDKGVPQSEDCLYLNIWAPAGKGPFPVFVWIHGGGYTGGQAFAPIFDGTEFAQAGIVLVTVAYRLGVFGFMDLGPLLGHEYAGSGNNALRDLVRGLEWVHHEIAAFGGDPHRVTVGGESAGAKATAALMALPEATPLFQSAISESGGGERVWTLPAATEVAQDYGKLWREAHSDAGLRELLSAPAEQLIQTQSRLIATSNRHFPLRPEVDGSYLKARPVDMVARGSSHGKRLLIGTNRDESALFLGADPKHDPTARDLGNLAPGPFDAVLAKYKQLYPQMPEPQRRIRATSAEEYWVPSVRMADAQTRNGGPTWMYRLDYAPSSGNMSGEAYHSEDLSLVWQRPTPGERANPAALALSRAMHLAWVAFLHGQAPAAPSLPAWPEYTASARETMILNTNSHVERQPWQAELRLWDGVL